MQTQVMFHHVFFVQDCGDTALGWLTDISMIRDVTVDMRVGLSEVCVT